MSGYVAPLPDIKFVMENIARLEELMALPPYEHVDTATILDILAEGARFVEDLVAPLNRIGDREGSKLVDGSVVTPTGFKVAYKAYVDTGWGGIDFPSEWGGHQMPKVVGMAFEEMLTSANLSFSLCPLLTFSGIDALLAHGSEDQKATYLSKLISGEWTATMNLTESHAGSDVGAIRTKAEKDGDVYRISGTKIFITYGDHDLAENVIHLVLARTPGAPPGTKGISMFIVPKFLPNPDGSIGEPNDVTAVSIEHKLGINASPTCVMSYGEKTGGAVGWLLGSENEGMRNMFTMMNTARISVGLEGMAVAERAYQQASQYASERRQGRAVGSTEDSVIAQHPDVRRMLFTMRSNIEAMRALLYRTAMYDDLSRYSAEADEREWTGKAVSLLTPIVKTWCTDLGVTLTSLGVQVHGGMGFIEETGAAQHFRDARIAPIYEGTNGIQAIDLVMRKISMDEGRFVGELLDEMRAAAEHLMDLGWEEEAARLSQAIEDLAAATEWLIADGRTANDRLAGATPYCSIFGIVAGGWMMAESVLVAGDNEDKKATARFYLQQILPTAAGHGPSVSAGANALFAIDGGQN